MSSNESIQLVTPFLWSRLLYMEWGCFLCITEFIEVGKPARALDTLYEVFRNKKWAYSWSESVLEPIMFKYLDLCVELKKSHIAKEGLFQYRNMFQSVSLVAVLLTDCLFVLYIMCSVCKWSSHLVAIVGRFHGCSKMWDMIECSIMCFHMKQCGGFCSSGGNVMSYFADNIAPLLWWLLCFLWISAWILWWLVRWRALTSNNISW